MMNLSVDAFRGGAVNCKQGDLAVIVRRSERTPHILGAVVTVLKAAPAGRFRLPDGYYNQSRTDRPAGLHWVVRFARQTKGPLVGGGWRATFYGVVPDSALRPIRDNDGEDETLSWIGKPEQVTA